MAGKNINQIATAATSILATDKMYIGRSPFGLTDDRYILGSSLITQFGSPLTTKGDLYTYSTENARLAVGSTNGQILQAASGQATGLAWSTATYPATAGASGNVLTSDGTNWTSAAPSGGGGDYVLIGTVTASNDAILELDLTGSYTSYQLIWDNIFISASNKQILLNCSQDGGSTWDTGSNYAYIVHMWSTADTSPSVNNSNGDTKVVLGGFFVDSAYSFCGDMMFYNPVNAASVYCKGKFFVSRPFWPFYYSLQRFYVSLWHGKFFKTFFRRCNGICKRFN